MSEIKPKRAIFRHRQDTATNCGRACVQSIVSSLVQSPPDKAPPPSPTDPVPVDQAVLRTRELAPADLQGDVWYTHPDELLALLKTAPELDKLPHHNRAAWRIGNHASVELLIADVVAALKAGVSPVVNVFNVDHWVVVLRALENGGALQALIMASPTDLPQTAPHTYRDACNALSDGHIHLTWPIDPKVLGAFSFDIGTTPPPAGLKDYSGRFVTIAHGAKPKQADLKKMVKTLGVAPAVAAATVTAAATGPGDPLLAELRARATEWDLLQLQRLLGSKAQTQVRLVKDIDGGPQAYRLMSVFSEDLQYGLVAVFSADAPRLAHFQFTTSRTFEQTLRTTAESETLWWTRQRQLTFGMPYFPFRRTLDLGEPKYRRLIDDMMFSPL